MNLNQKKLISRLFVILCFLTVSNVFAEPNSKGQSSPVVVGKLTSFDDASQTLVVQTKDAKRELRLNKISKLEFVGMPDKADHKITIGYGVKGKVEKDGSIKGLIFTVPLPEAEPLGKDRITMTLPQIYKLVDQNADGKISYLEFSVKVYLSEKHGPDKFKKYDKDQDGTFDEKEFSKALTEVSWWKMSRKTPDQWIEIADENKDGKLSLKEFTEIVVGKNHVDNHFKRTDKDKSGNLNRKEATSYINGVIGVNPSS